MLSVGQVTRIKSSQWFQARTAPYLVVDAALRIRAVNAAYERATAQPQESLIGRPMFEAFPDNPADADADGVANLSGSLESVLRSGAPHWMGVQRYDVPDQENPGNFRYKVWAPVNSPIRDNSSTVAVLHHVQDVTRQVSPPARPAPNLGLAQLRKAAEALAKQFPEVLFEELVGVLTHSHQVVLKTLGSPNIARARELAKLRLEVRAGRPGASGHE